MARRVCAPLGASLALPPSREHGIAEPEAGSRAPAPGAPARLYAGFASSRAARVAQAKTAQQRVLRDCWGPAGQAAPETEDSGGGGAFKAGGRGRAERSADSVEDEEEESGDSEDNAAKEDKIWKPNAPIGKTDVPKQRMEHLWGIVRSKVHVDNPKIFQALKVMEGNMLFERSEKHVAEARRLLECYDARTHLARKPRLDSKEKHIFNDESLPDTVLQNFEELYNLLMDLIGRSHSIEQEDNDLERKSQEDAQAAAATEANVAGAERICTENDEFMTSSNAKLTEFVKQISSMLYPCLQKVEALKKERRRRIMERRVHHTELDECERHIKLSSKAIRELEESRIVASRRRKQELELLRSKYSELTRSLSLLHKRHEERTRLDSELKKHIRTRLESKMTGNVVKTEAHRLQREVKAKSNDLKEVAEETSRLEAQLKKSRKQLQEMKTLQNADDIRISAIGAVALRAEVQQLEDQLGRDGGFHPPAPLNLDLGRDDPALGANDTDAPAGLLPQLLFELKVQQKWLLERSQQLEIDPQTLVLHRLPPLASPISMATCAISFVNDIESREKVSRFVDKRKTKLRDSMVNKSRSILVSKISESRRSRSGSIALEAMGLSFEARCDHILGRVLQREFFYPEDDDDDEDEDAADMTNNVNADSSSGCAGASPDADNAGSFADGAEASFGASPDAVAPDTIAPDAVAADAVAADADANVDAAASNDADAINTGATGEREPPPHTAKPAPHDRNEAKVATLESIAKARASASWNSDLDTRATLEAIAILSDTGISIRALKHEHAKACAQRQWLQTPVMEHAMETAGRLIADLSSAHEIAARSLYWFEEVGCKTPGVFCDLLASKELMWLTRLAPHLAGRCGSLRAAAALLTDAEGFAQRAAGLQDPREAHARTLQAEALCACVAEELDGQEFFFDESLQHAAESWQVRLQQSLRKQIGLHDSTYDALRWYVVQQSLPQSSGSNPLLTKLLKGLEYIKHILHSPLITGASKKSTMLAAEHLGILHVTLEQVLKSVEPEAYEASILALEMVQTTIYGLPFGLQGLSDAADEHAARDESSFVGHPAWDFVCKMEKGDIARLNNEPSHYERMADAELDSLLLDEFLRSLDGHRGGSCSSLGMSDVSEEMITVGSGGAVDATGALREGSPVKEQCDALPREATSSTRPPSTLSSALPPRPPSTPSTWGGPQTRPPSTRPPSTWPGPRDDAAEASSDGMELKPLNQELDASHFQDLPDPKSAVGGSGARHSQEEPRVPSGGHALAGSSVEHISSKYGELSSELSTCVATSGAILNESLSPTQSSTLVGISTTSVGEAPVISRSNGKPDHSEHQVSITVGGQQVDELGQEAVSVEEAVRALGVEATWCGGSGLNRSMRRQTTAQMEEEPTTTTYLERGKASLNVPAPCPSPNSMGDHSDDMESFNLADHASNVKRPSQQRSDALQHHTRQLAVRTSNVSNGAGFADGCNGSAVSASKSLPPLGPTSSLKHVKRSLDKSVAEGSGWCLMSNASTRSTILAGKDEARLPLPRAGDREHDADGTATLDVDDLPCNIGQTSRSVTPMGYRRGSAAAGSRPSKFGGVEERRPDGDRAPSDKRASLMIASGAATARTGARDRRASMVPGKAGSCRTQAVGLAEDLGVKLELFNAGRNGGGDAIATKGNRKPGPLAAIAGAGATGAGGLCIGGDGAGAGAGRNVGVLQVGKRRALPKCAEPPEAVAKRVLQAMEARHARTLPWLEELRARAQHHPQSARDPRREGTSLRLSAKSPRSLERELGLDLEALVKTVASGGGLAGDGGDASSSAAGDAADGLDEATDGITQPVPKALEAEDWHELQSRTLRGGTMRCRQVMEASVEMPTTDRLCGTIGLWLPLAGVASTYDGASGTILGPRHTRMGSSHSRATPATLQK